MTAGNLKNQNTLCETKIVTQIQKFWVFIFQKLVTQKVEQSEVIY